LNTKILNGWTIGQFVDLVSPAPNSIRRGPFGSAIKKSFFVSKGFKVYEQKNAIYDDCTLGNYFISEEKYKELNGFSVKPGDFIVSCAGTIGRISQLPKTAPEGVINQALMKVTLNRNIVDSKFFHFLFRSPEFQDKILKDTRGSAMKNMSSINDIKAQHVNLPPLPEQKRIAAKLDNLLAKVDACNARLDKVPEIIKRFRQSVLADATSGRLTEDWRAENGIDNILTDTVPFGWERVKLGNISRCISGAAFKKRDYSESGSKLLQIANVSYGKILWEKRAYIPFELAKEYPDLKLDRGDFVLALNRPITNGYLKIARLGEADLPATLYQRVGKIVLFDKQIAEYFFHALRTQEVLAQVEDNLKGSDQPYLNTSLVPTLEINLPPKPEQKEIVRRVESLFVVADQMEEKLKNAEARVDKLTVSILAKAFRGELVPQDPNDPPASELLERIRAERAAPATTQKISTRTKKKSKDNLQSLKVDQTEIAVKSASVEPLRKSIPEEPTQTPTPTEQLYKPKEPRFEKSEVLPAFRKAIFRQNEIDELSLLRLVGNRLGVKRLSQPIRAELESYINTAIRRKILIRDSNGFSAGTSTIQYYDDDYLIKVLGSVTKKGWQYPRDYLIDEAAQYLGFGKPSDAFNDRMKSIFRKAIREGALYRNGKYVGKN